MLRSQLMIYLTFAVILKLSFSKTKRGLFDISDPFAIPFTNYKIQPIKGLDDIFSKVGSDQLKFVNDQFTLATTDPEATMVTEDIIRYHGYPVEIYEVTTDDGYILTIQRLPYGTSGPTGTPRKPVLIMHGLLGSSVIWVANTKDKNLAYILADAGYDVWLGNIRGNSHGQKHTHMNPTMTKFWQFSFDEMAKYDVPAIINKILEQTGHQQILYIGHSMGTTMVFAMLASQPKYNKIIRTVLALAPVATVEHILSPLRLLSPFVNQLGYAADLFGNGEFKPDSTIMNILSTTVCNSPIRILCSNALFLIAGFNLPQLNQTRLPVYLHHVPSATSIQNLVHFTQMVNSREFQYQDYGSEKNKAVYGQPEVPLYDLSKVTTEVVLVWSDNDYLAAPKDVDRLAHSLPNLVSNYRVPLHEFSHLDFMWAIDVKALLYDKLLSFMEESWKD